jgi:hypothetical protein
MTLTTDRFTSRECWAYAALDTIDPLIDHVLGILGEDREMTLIQRYRTSRDDNDMGLGNATIKTGLTVADPAEYNVPVIDRFEQRDPHGKGLRVFLQPGLTTGFGFSAYARDAPTEKAVRARYNDKNLRRRDITLVRTNGWPGDPSREDRIEIEDWNEHGVCSDVVIAFTR